MSNTPNKKKAILLASSTMFLQGFEGVYITLIGLFFLVSQISNPSFSSALLLSKEIFGLIVAVIFFGPKIIISILKKIKYKETWLYIGAGAFGTSLGNFFYILAIALAGSSYGVILNSLYPVFALFLLRFITKQKQNKYVWFGALLTIIAGSLFISLPSFIHDKETFSYTKIIGLFAGSLAALFWAIEVFLISLATRLKGAIYNDKEKLVARSMSSLFFTIIFIIPITYIWGDSFKNFSLIITNWKSLLIIFFMSLNVVLLRMVFSKSIKYAGIGTTSIIDSNNFLVTPILSLGLNKISGLIDSNFNPLFKTLDWWAWLLVIPIFIGVYMVVKFNKDDEEKKQIAGHETNI